MDYSNYLQTVVILAFVVGLILVGAWVARRSGLGSGAGRASGRRRRRLSVIETAAVDAKRRLVLVRRDGREHLLLVGGGNDLVIERHVAAPDALNEEPRL